MSVIQEKQKKVDQLTENLKQSRGIIVANYRGLTVTELTDLASSRLRKYGSVATVYKNGITKRAFQISERKYPEDLLKGPNILVTTDTDAVNMSKQVVDFSKETEKLTIKGGFLSEDYIDDKMINQLAKLPSRDELIAKAVGLIKAPLSGLVMRLASPVNGLVNVLNNIKEEKTIGGDNMSEEATKTEEKDW